MARPRLAEVGGPHLPTCSPGDAIHRCVGVRMGGSIGSADGLRVSGTRVDSVTHKYVGSGFQSPSPVCPTSEGETRPAEFRQYNSVLLSKQTREGQVGIPISEGRVSPSMVRGPLHIPDSEFRSREAERPSRSAEQVPHGSTIRVDDSSRVTETNLGALEDPVGRPVCI